MKKINYLYFICMTLMWYFVDQLLDIVSHYSGLLLLLIICLYISWYILSAPLFYMLRKRKGVKDGFMTVYCMETQWTTLWIDLSNRELAYLCMFNPFQIHYLPLDSVSSAAIDIHYTKDKAFIHYLNCSFCINGRPNKIQQPIFVYRDGDRRQKTDRKDAETCRSPEW